MDYVKKVRDEKRARELNARFLAKISGIKDSTREIRELLPKVERLHSQALKHVAEEQISRNAKAVAKLSDDIERLIRSCQKSIGELRKAKYDNDALDSRLRHTQEHAVTKELISVIQEYREIQVRYKDQQVLNFSRQYRIVSPNATNEEIQTALDAGALNNVFAQSIVQLEAQQTLCEVKARHEDIKNIERCVVQLIAMLDEIQLMLDSQDETILDIDAQVDTAAYNLQLGSGEISTAIAHRLSTRKMAWAACSCLIVLLVISGVLIYVYAIKPLLDNQQQK